MAYLCVRHTVSPAKMAEPIEMFGGVDSGGPKISTRKLITKMIKNITLSIRNAAEDNFLTMNICHTIVERPKINTVFTQITC